MVSVMLGSVKMEFEEIESIPEARCYSTACVINKELHIIGGCDSKGKPVASVYRFDGSSWQVAPPMNVARASPAVVVLCNKAIAIGGISVTQAPSDKIELYDGEKWTLMSVLPEALMGIASVQLTADTSVIMGGMAIDTCPRDTVRQVKWEDGTTKWQNLPPMPTPRYSVHLSYYQDNIFAVGGRCGKRPVNAVESYDTISFQWTSWMNIPTDRVFSSINVAYGTMIIAGGLPIAKASGFQNICEYLDLSKKASISDWQGHKRRALTVARGDASCCVYDGWFVNFGGITNTGKPCNVVDGINLRKQSTRFQRLPELPKTRATAISIMINDDFYMIGGLSDNGPCTDVMKVKFSRSTGEYDMCNENLANKVPKSDTIEAFAGLNIS